MDLHCNHRTNNAGLPYPPMLAIIYIGPPKPTILNVQVSNGRFECIEMIL